MSMLADLDTLASRGDSFIALVDELPADALRPAAWGPREVLSHLAYWHEHYVRLLEAALAGERPALPAGSFRDLNAGAVAHFRATPVHEIAHRFASAERALEYLARRPGASRIQIRIEDGAMARRLPVLLARVAGHIAGHERQLRHEYRIARRARDAALAT